MIKTAGDLIKQAKKDLINLQTGVSSLIRTGKEAIDQAVGGLLPSDVILIGGLSSMGKTFFLEELKRNIMTPEFNPDCDNFIVLSYNLEMKFFNLMLRGLNEVTGKKKDKILKESFTEDELIKVKEFMKSYSDDRFYVEEQTLTPNEFYEQTHSFLEENKDKGAVIVTIDHISLFKGSDKFKVIAEVVEAINKLKMEFSNVYFIVLSQLNRELLKRSEAKSNLAIPRSSDFENSSTINQLAAYSLIVHQPYRLNITEFGKLNPSFYSYLSEHFVDAGQNKVSLSTENRVFTFLVKSRESEIGFKNIFIDKVGNNTTQEPKSTTTLLKEIEAPSFEDQLQDNVIKPNLDFDTDFSFNEEREDLPF